MKFGLHALHRGNNIEPGRLGHIARRCEEMGFESLWVGDHIALPPDAPDAATEPRLEALTALAYLAAITDRVRLGVGVLVLPQRQPVLLAKQLTSIDRMSDGRLIVGVAAGEVQAELAAFGVPLEARSERTDEHLAAMRALWAHDTNFDGATVQFGNVSQHPQPVQQPHPPIVVGGHATKAVRRAAIQGDGWFGWDLSPEQVAAHVARLGEIRRTSSRADTPLEITVVADRELTPSTVRQYENVGVHRLVVVPASMLDTSTETLVEHIGSTLIR